MSKPKMLKHKETGELFVYTDLLAKNSVLELVVEDPVQEVLNESQAQTVALASEGEPTETDVASSTAEAEVSKTAAIEIPTLGGAPKKASKKD